LKRFLTVRLAAFAHNYFSPGAMINYTAAAAAATSFINKILLT
jgi:hypothetical protein